MKVLRRSNSIRLSLLFFFVSFYFFTNAGWYLPGDELTMLKVAKKMVSTSYLGFRLEETSSEAEDDLVKGRSGLYYYKYGLGQSLVESPFLLLHQTFFGWSKPDLDYSMSELLFVLLCPSLVSAVGCILIFNLSNLLRFSRKTSLGLALVYD